MTEPPKPLIDSILRETLGPHGFDHAEVKVGYDHDDEEALFIDAILKPNSPLVEADAYSGALGALSDALLKNGDRRFPYLSLHHPDAEPAEPSWSLDDFAPP
jgi:hypothetical protein